MRRIFATFIQGLAVVVPVVFTFYVLYAAVRWLDVSIVSLISNEVSTFPGMGLAVGILIIYVVGLLTRLYLFRNLVSRAEKMIERLPLVKTLYSSVRDLLQFFSQSDSTPKGTPVRVRLTEDSHVLGIATVPSDGDRIGVYLPLSYQIGGYFVYLPPSRVSPLDLDVESTLKLIMTGGLSANVEESALARLAPNAEIVEPAHTTHN
jgi:uncharacterized membrane protein